MRRRDLAAERWAAEIRQGTVLARRDADRVWGWNSGAGRIRADRRAAFLIERCGLQAGVRCLELGAGTGTFTERLIRSGCELVAVELSPESAARCRERVNGRATVVVGNVETGEGLEGETFDAIVGVSVLHHVDMRVTLGVMSRVLRVAGRFAFSEPNIRNPLVWAERQIPWLRHRRHVLPHEQAFTAAGLRRAFEYARFVVEVSEPFDFLIPSTSPRLIPLADKAGRALERSPLRAIAGSVRIAGRKPQ